MSDNASLKYDNFYAKGGTLDGVTSGQAWTTGSLTIGAPVVLVGAQHRGITNVISLDQLCPSTAMRADTLVHLTLRTYGPSSSTYAPSVSSVVAGTGFYVTPTNSIAVTIGSFAIMWSLAHQT